MKPLLSFLPLLPVVCAQSVLAQNSPASMTIAFPAKEGERVVSVSFEVPATGKPAGLGGVVTVE
jgi:hypothetical protein